MSKFKYLLITFLLCSTGLPLTSYAGPCIVPVLIGLTETQAISDLDGIECLNYGGSSRQNDSAPVDEVIGQDPSSGTEIASPPGAVTLTVSDGPTTTTTTTTTTAAPTTTTAAPTTTTAAATTTTTAGATTTTAAATTTTTAGATTTTAAATTTTTAGATTTTAAGTTTTTLGGGGTTTTTAAATTTTAASTTTTAASTTTTTLPPQGEETVPDVPLDGGDGTVTISTESGEEITDVSTGEATNAPSGLVFPFGTISYTTTSPVGGSVTMTFDFSADLPDPLSIYKVDNNGNYNELPTNIWKKVDANTVEVTVTDGDVLTDMDGVANGSIEDPIAVAGQQSSGGGGDDDVFDFGGGGCTIGNTQSSGMDPIWLFLLLAPGLGILRRRVATTGTVRRKNA